MKALHLGAFVCCRLPFLSPGCETGLKGEPVGEAPLDQEDELLAARTLPLGTVASARRLQVPTPVLVPPVSHL